MSELELEARLVEKLHKATYIYSVWSGDIIKCAFTLITGLLFRSQMSATNSIYQADSTQTAVAVIIIVIFTDDYKITT